MDYFKVGVVGPVTSVVVGIGCLAVAVVLGWAPGSDPARPAHAVLVWLGYINLGLALFNMIPG